jgi:hypothetical protein
MCAGFSFKKSLFESTLFKLKPLMSVTVERDGLPRCIRSLRQSEHYMERVVNCSTDWSLQLNLTMFCAGKGDRPMFVTSNPGQMHSLE